MSQAYEGPQLGHTERAGPKSTEGSFNLRLMFWFGATLPFPLLGVPLNEYFVLSVTSTLGLIFGFRRLLREGWQPLHRSAAIMLLAFAATSALRHPITSYVISLGALCVALLPNTTPLASNREIRALMRGLRIGLWVTLWLVAAVILVQVAGVLPSLGAVGTWLVGAPQTGTFLGYIRPTGGFSEPSHLAIYLACTYVAFDLFARPGGAVGTRRPLIAMAIVFVGSMSGLVLLAAYLVAKWLSGVRNLFLNGASGRRLVRATMFAGALLGLGAYLSFGQAGFIDEYGLRLVRALEDIDTGNLVGSEGSRVNAVLALPTYWEESGWSGVFFGTGYANYHNWLLDTFGYLNVSATFSRGEVDSILVVVFLSTGILGLALYLSFLFGAFGFRATRMNAALIVFVLTLNFSYGYLISGLYWNLLFVLATAARNAAGTWRLEHSRSWMMSRQGQTAAA